MGSLTEVRLQAWTKARRPIAGKSDGGGLTFTLSRAGTATWVLRYRIAGKARELTLGNYPDMPLKKARKGAAAARAKIDGGVDVASEKRKDLITRSRAGTFRQLAEDYMIRAAPKLAPRTQDEVHRYLDKDILPRIGHLPVGELSGADMVGVVEKVAARSHSVARRAFQFLSVIFAHGIAKHMAKSNPCAGLKLSAILGESPKRRERIKLTDKEIRAILAALPELGRSNELAAKILLATCVRKGELIRAKWANVDLEAGVWTVPNEDSKSGKGFCIPLAPTVAAWFSELSGLACGSDWVLPSLKGGRVNKASHISNSTLNVALGRLDCKARDFSPHDLRSTARSHLAALGVDVLVAERCLNHSLGGLVAVYDQHDYMDERRRALELWAAYLNEAEKARPWNVAPIRAKAAA